MYRSSISGNTNSMPATSFHQAHGDDLVSVTGKEQKRCRHCGLTSDSEFCCEGCRTVYETLHELGLQEFYRWRDSEANVAQPAANPAFSDLDRFSILQPSHDGDLATFTFEISGIHCAGCLWILDRLSRVQHGVVRTALNASTGELTVWFRHSEVSLTAIARLLSRLGYPPREAQPSDKNKASRLPLLRIGVAGFAAMNTMMLAVSLFQGLYTGIEDDVARVFRWVSLLLSTPAVLWAGLPLYRQALRALTVGRIHIELPLTVAIFSAYILSGVNTFLDRPFVYFDSVCLLIFLLLISRSVQEYAMTKARRASRLGWSVLPATAHLRRGSEIVTVRLEELTAGDTVVIAPGDRIPIDGVIVEGETAVDRSILSGEPHPIEMSVDDFVEAGSLNLTSQVVICVRAVGEDTRIGKILTDMRKRGLEKGALARFTDLVGRWYLAGLGLATIITASLHHETLAECIESILTLYVVTCPCALAFSLPTIYGLMIGRAASRGILIKSAAVIERLASIRKLYLDKTGTLTTGVYQVKKERWFFGCGDIFRSTLAQLTSAQPRHPVSAALRRQLDLPTVDASSCRVVAGKGVEFTDDAGDIWRVGAPKWAGSVEFQSEKKTDSTVVFARNSDILAQITLGDALRDTTPGALARLKELGCAFHLLSGDQESTVRAIARSLDLDEVSALGDLTPNQKAEVVTQAPYVTAFVGDGVNDVLALKAAHVGIAIAGGLEATAEAADIVITKGSLEQVEATVRAARRARRIAVGSLAISLCYNVAAASVAVSGMMNPLIAAFLMPTSSLLVMVLALTVNPFSGRSFSAREQ